MHPVSVQSAFGVCPAHVHFLFGAVGHPFDSSWCLCLLALPCRFEPCRDNAHGSFMDPRFEHVLNSLPPKKPRSRLEPYRELIREMRKRRCSYRGIAQVLHDHFGLRVAASTVNNFVISRLDAQNRSKRNQQSLSGRIQKERGDSFRPPKILQDTFRCVENVKQPTRSKSVRPGPFHYDEDEPLRFIPRDKHSTTSPEE